MKVFFATDVHGSEICWRKFLNAAAFYKADMVILGGDVTGKVLVPILAMPGYWEVSFGGQRLRLETKTELDEIQRKIRDRGSYPSVMAPEELDALSEDDGSVDRRFTLEMTRGLDRWLDMADGKLRGGDIPCILNGGERRHLGDRRHHRAVPLRQLRREQGARHRRLLPGLDGLDQPDAVEYLPRGARGCAGHQDRRDRVADPGGGAAPGAL